MPPTNTENEIVDIPLFTVALKKGTPFFELLVRAFQKMPETYSLLWLLFVTPKNNKQGPEAPDWN